MAKEKIEIVVDADTSKASKELAGFSNKSLGGVQKAAHNAIGVAIGIGLAAIPGLVVKAGRALWDFGMRGVELDATRQTFDNLAESIGAVSDELLIGLREATSGMVSDAELIEGANRMMAMGLAESASEAERLSEMAVQLGAAMGEEAGPALENFSLMLANQSIPRLDSFGISGNDVRLRMEELQAQVDGMSRDEAFKLAVMEIGAESMKTLGDQSETTAGKLQQFKIDIQNAKDAVGLFIAANLITPLVDSFSFLGEKLNYIKELAAPAFEQGMDSIRAQLGQTQQVLLDSLGIVGLNIDSWDDLTLAVGFSFDAFLAFKTQQLIEDMTLAFAFLSLAIDNINKQIMQFNEQIEMAIEWIKYFKALVKSWMIDNDIELPDWMMPGSPTPLETGIRGITDALNELPRLSDSFGLNAGGQEAGALAGGGNTNNNYNLTIHSQANTEQVAADFDMMRAWA